MSLIGPAGSGKTTIMKALIDFAEIEGTKRILTATTHEAAKVLSNSTGKIASTIHSYLGAKMVQDEETGEEYLSTPANNEELQNTLVLVDESSQLVRSLLNGTMKHGAKFLFVGDAAQLKPVNEPPCPAVIKSQCAWEFAELTTVHRQALDSPILAQANEVRLGTPKLRHWLKEGEGVHVLKPSDWKAQWLERLDGPVLAYRNLYCDTFNADARESKGFDAPYVVGERLVMHERYHTGEVVIQNGTRIGVTQVAESNVMGEKGWVLCDDYGNFIPVCKDYHARKKRLKYESEAAALNKKAGRRNAWRGYFDFKNNCADVRAGYAMTVHRSQGSTYRNVYIDLRDYASSPERLSLLYVAMTRASNNVYITGL